MDQTRSSALKDERHARQAFSYAVQKMHDVAAGDEETMRVTEFSKPIDDNVTILHWVCDFPMAYGNPPNIKERETNVRRLV